MSFPVDLSVDFCGRRFKNPFLLSSSPVSNSAEMVERSTPVCRASSAWVILRAAIASPRRARNWGARSRLSILSIR